jgi:putative endonuclease
MFAVYIVRCRDNSLYVGVTSDLESRLRAHNEGRGGRHTASRYPVDLVYSEYHDSAQGAVARECQLKRWTRHKKEALIAGATRKLKEFSRCRNK